MSFISRPGIIIHRKITWLLLFSIISLAIASGSIYYGERNIESTNFRIDQTYEVIGTIQQLLTSVAESQSYPDATPESGSNVQRESRSYPNAQRYLDSLQRLTRQNNDQQEHIALLRKYLSGKSASGDRLYSVPVSTIKSLLYTMEQEEKDSLALRRHTIETANRRTLYGMLITRVGAFLFVVIILVQLNKDISRRKAAQEQVVRAMQEAQEAKQMQEQFLANMSHEIRTPMNGIKGMTDLLLGTPLTDKQHELAGIIKSSVNNLLVIINDILDFSKIKAGKLNIEKIDFSIKDVLNGAAAIFDHRLKKKKLPLRVDVDPNIPRRLTGDPHRLNQVLINLLGNAIKFTQQGHIHIRVALQQRSEDKVVLSFTVTDTGVGIPADSIPYIFDSFSQAGQDISRRYGGTGLGLTICKQLLHLQGGDITAASTVGTGSVFSFTLPYEYNDQPDPEWAVINRPHDYSTLLAGRRFLVAEDNEINQKLIDYVLKKAGGTVELVNNGAEAIEYLQNGMNVDLIIMDLQMPEMDGYAATQYIRKDLQMQTPIIAMTATAMKGEHLQCLESGMNEYMTKPFEFADLYKRIGSLLSPI